MSEPVMVFGKNYCPPREKDRQRKDRHGHYMGCFGGAGCEACRCGGSGDDFLWMSEDSAKRAGAEFDLYASANYDAKLLDEHELQAGGPSPTASDVLLAIETDVANRIADWLDANGYLAPTQLIREGRWRDGR